MTLVIMLVIVAVVMGLKPRQKGFVPGYAGAFG